MTYRPRRNHAEIPPFLSTDRNHAKFIYAGDDRIGMIDPAGNVYYYLKDHLGSTRVTLRDNGVVYGRYYEYKAFGDVVNESVTLNQAYKFTGKPLDVERGLNLYYFGARYYDPALGRWLSPDPLHGKNPGVSPYIYCLDNPLRFIDRDGRSSAESGPKQEEDPLKKLQESLGLPKNAGEVAANVENKAKAAAKEVVEKVPGVVEQTAGVVEKTAGAMGTALVIGGVVSGQPALTGAGVALNRIAVVASAVKVAVNPTPTVLGIAFIIYKIDMRNGRNLFYKRV